ncbi:hypothetical protein QBC39DRAFT_355956 [Podospora conica]|nr:hypothetical protein QBC39DRAFT_355956 [Schizothecium conicum]
MNVDLEIGVNASVDIADVEAVDRPPELPGPQEAADNAVGLGAMSLIRPMAPHPHIFDPPRQVPGYISAKIHKAAVFWGFSDASMSKPSLLRGQGATHGNTAILGSELPPSLEIVRGDGTQGASISRATQKSHSNVTNDPTREPRAASSRPNDDADAKIEFLHRYNVLWARARLIRQYNDRYSDLVNDQVATGIYQDLHRYSNALRDYQLFRAEGRFLFRTDYNSIMQLAGRIWMLEEIRSRLQGIDPESEEAKAIAKDADKTRKEARKELVETVAFTTSGMTKEQGRKDEKAFRARLLAALGGGLALIVPMLVMVLAPPAKATALATTCCFVLAVGIALAFFMKDSQPKDVVASTAAYAAVLVVFVGVGGGTSS